MVSQINLLNISSAPDRQTNKMPTFHTPQRTLRKVDRSRAKQGEDVRRYLKFLDEVDGMCQRSEDCGRILDIERDH